MTDDTIMGGPSGSTSPDPSVTEPTDPAPDQNDAGGSEAESRAFDPLAVPGDATTAVHRSQLYALLALGFERPGDDFEAAVADDAYTDGLVAAAEAIDDVDADGDADVADAARTVASHLDDPDRLHDEWASLFGVEEGLTVSPYQLTYIPGPLMTNVRQLADLRGFYQAFGLSVVEGQNDRPDHICFLTEFLGHLCTREAHFRSEDDAEGLSVAVDAQRSFVEDHLGRWYWRFADEVSQQDGHGFYAALADLLAALVAHDVDRLDCDPDWVPDHPDVTEWNEDVFGDAGRGCGGCGSDATGIDDLEADLVPDSESSTADGAPGDASLVGDGLLDGDASLDAGESLDGSGSGGR